MIKKLAIDNKHDNPAYTPTTFAKEEIMNKYRSVLSAVKTGLQNYCVTIYSRGGMNQTWILLEFTQSRSLSSCNINKMYFSTCSMHIYSSFRTKRLIKRISLTACYKVEWPTKIHILILLKKYDLPKISQNWYHQKFSIENIFVLFQQRADIHMNIHRAPLLID